MVSAKPSVWAPTQALWLKAVALWSGSKAQPARLLARPDRAAAKPAISHFSKPPVQGELSLDRVAVVRNDLSEADLEVVPAKPKAAADLMVAEPVGAVESIWKRATPRMFHAGKR